MSTPSTSAHDTHPTEGAFGFGTILRPIEALGFWAAIGLPFVYMPLVLSGVQTTTEQVAVGILIVTHMVALFLGRHYRTE